MTVTDETSKNSTEKEENKTVTVGEENAASNTEDITSVQLALAEIFEIIINGGI